MEYRVSNSGNDANTGKKGSPWKTLYKLSTVNFEPGDIIQIERNSVFYESLTIKNQRSENNKKVTITSYGNGKKPKISAHKFSKDAGAWSYIGGNVWRTNLKDLDKFVGNQKTDDQSANVGHIRVNGEIFGCKKFGAEILEKAFDFKSDMATGDVDIYCTSNPFTVASSIAFAVGQRLIEPEIISGNRMPITGLRISGLDFVGCAGHVLGDAAKDVDLMGCEFREIGGAHLIDAPQPNTRYGNGIQAGNTSRRMRVYGNKFSKIYDTATTCQGDSITTLGWDQIAFRFNEISECEQAFEIYAMNNVDNSWTENTGLFRVEFSDNECFRIGYGWSHDVRPDQNSASPLLFYKVDAPVIDVEIARNTFRDFRGPLITSGSGSDLPANKGYRLIENKIHARDDQKIFNLASELFDEFQDFESANSAYLWSKNKVLIKSIPQNTIKSFGDVTASAISKLAEELRAVKYQINELWGNCGRLNGLIESETEYKTGNGEPTYAPEKLGERYFDLTNLVEYYAIGIGSGATNWRRNNNTVDATSDPGSAPTFVGRTWVNRTTKKTWMACGTSSVADWVALN